VAIFTKEHLQWLSNSSLLTVAGCYRPPSAPACTLNSLLAPYTKSEYVLLGDLNWDMIKPPDQVLKQWDSLNLSQIFTNPTKDDSKHPEKATRLDVILTNNTDRHQSGVVCNDLSDHCFTACARNGCPDLS
jgi:endonuclease/exonuclease/phosphatase family metal-dependent hydrolase